MRSYFFALLSAVVLFLLTGFIIPEGYEIGDTVKDFRLKNVDGKFVSLSDYKDVKGFIVIFDCNTCPYSKTYNSRIVALGKKFQGSYPVIAINSNDPGQSPGDSFEDNVRHSKENGYNFPYLFDETQQVAKAFGATNTPHVFILAKSGENLRVVYIGTIDDNARNPSSVKKKYVEAAIEELETGKAVSITRTRALGCTIKWK